MCNSNQLTMINYPQSHSFDLRKNILYDGFYLKVIAIRNYELINSIDCMILY